MWIVPSQSNKGAHYLVNIQKSTVQSLLAGLCEGIVQPPHTGRGRPPLPLADLVYVATMKIYSGMSGRRAMTDIEDGLNGKAPSYNAIFAAMQGPDLTPLLTSMVEGRRRSPRRDRAKLPVDATGFATTTYDRWFDKKWGREKKRQKVGQGPCDGRHSYQT